jgi:hypothetical protein
MNAKGMCGTNILMNHTCLFGIHVLMAHKVTGFITADGYINQIIRNAAKVIGPYLAPISLNAVQ